MIREINQDVLKQDPKPDLICHSVNAQKIMGSGLAKQVKEAFPSVFRQYVQICEAESDASGLLGRAFIIKPEESQNAPYVANLFSQLRYGTETRQTDYEAFYKSLEQVKKFMVSNKLSFVSFPKGIGCGIGGGSWKVIKAMIETVFAGDEWTVVICDFQPRD